MAFHDHLSHEMALHHFTDQHMTDNTAVLRGIFPESTGKQPDITGGSGGGAPTWLNSAILRQQAAHHHYGGGGGGGEGRFLHLQTTHNNNHNTTPDSSASNNQWLSRSFHGDNDDVPTVAMMNPHHQQVRTNRGADEPPRSPLKSQ